MRVGRRTFTRHEVLLGVEALVAVTRARVMSRVVSFARITSGLGVATASDDQVMAVTPEQLAVAHDVSVAIARASHASPFGASCLAQSVAAQRMLRKRGVPSVTRFGARLDGGLRSHAWLTVADELIAGERHAQDYTEVLRFVSGGASVPG